jgi:ABC-type glucose/galactose transport system permease subunit
MRFAAALAVLGALVFAAGVGMVYLPAGVMVGGLELMTAAYVIGYLGVRREAA